MWPKTFEEMGVPPGYGFKRLIFCPAANALVLQTCSGSNAWRPERLYFRNLNWEKYLPIGTPAELSSQESPSVHSSEPLVAYVTVRHHFSVDADGSERHSGDWESLRVVNLETGQELHSISEQTLSLPTGAKRGWICNILAFGDPGLFVTAAITKDETLCEYFLAELVSMRIVKPIALLPATFM